MISVSTCINKALRHPLLIGFLYTYRIAIAYMVTQPLVGTLTPPWIMAQPQHDRSLVAAGSEILFRLLIERHDALLNSLRSSACMLIVAQVGEIIVSSYVMQELFSKGASNRCRHQRTVLWQFGRQLFVVLGYWIAVVAAGYLMTLLLSLLPTLVFPWVGERGTDIVILGILLLVMVAAGALRVLCDVLRALAIGSDCALTILFTEALDDIWDRLGYWALAGLKWALLVCSPALLVSGWFPVIGTATKLGWGPLIFRQCAILAMCVLQTSWWVFLIHNARNVLDGLHADWLDPSDDP